MVIEDEGDVRRRAVGCLGSLRYRPLEARNGESASGGLDQVPEAALLFTNVIVPEGVPGTELAREALRRRRNLEVLFASGYADEAIVKRDRLGENVEPIGKPYRKVDLVRRLRAIPGREED